MCFIIWYIQYEKLQDHLQDLIPILAGIKYLSNNTNQSRVKSCRCARECFICSCIWLHVFELTVTGWCFYSCIAISNWSELTTYFFTFYCDPYALLFFKFKIFVSCLFTFYRIVVIGILHSYNPIKCVYRSHWPCMA